MRTSEEDHFNKESLARPHIRGSMCTSVVNQGSLKFFHILRVVMVNMMACHPSLSSRFALCIPTVDVGQVQIGLLQSCIHHVFGNILQVLSASDL